MAESLSDICADYADDVRSQQLAKLAALGITKTDDLCVATEKDLRDSGVLLGLISRFKKRNLIAADVTGQETLLGKLLKGQRALATAMVKGQRALATAMVKGQTALAKEMKNLGLGVSASVWLTLWGDIVSTATSETTENFRKALVNFYGDDTDKENVGKRPEAPLRCMVTDLKLPGTWITAAHLLARRHTMKSHIFGIDDIDDPRNGLLWNRAVEEKFSIFGMVFSWCQEENTFITHVINKDLIDQEMRDAILRKPLNRSQDYFMDDATKERFDNLKFGDLDGKHVRFNNINRPFKRVLCAHAKLGLWKARHEEKLPPGFDLCKYNFEYCSDSPDSQLLKQFLADSQMWMNKENEDGRLDLVLKDLPDLQTWMNKENEDGGLDFVLKDLPDVEHLIDLEDGKDNPSDGKEDPSDLEDGKDDPSNGKEDPSDVEGLIDLEDGKEDPSDSHEV